MKKDQFDQICEMVRNHTTQLESILHHAYRNHLFDDIPAESLIDKLLSKQQGFTFRMVEIICHLFIVPVGWLEPVMDWLFPSSKW